MKEKSWDEFRKTGLLLIVNQLLHVFGWCIVVECSEDGSFRYAYPARTNHRGFSEESQQEAYAKVSKYMLDNATELVKETEN